MCYRRVLAHVLAMRAALAKAEVVKFEVLHTEPDDAGQPRLGVTPTPGGQVLPVALPSVRSVATKIFERSQPHGKGQVLIASPRPASWRQGLELGQLHRKWQPKPSTPDQIHHMTLPAHVDPEVIDPDQILGFQPSVGQTVLPDLSRCIALATRQT